MADNKIAFDKSIHITALYEYYDSGDGMGKMWDPISHEGGVITYNDLEIPLLNRLNARTGGGSSTHYPDGTPKPKPKPKPSGGGSSGSSTRKEIHTKALLDIEYKIFAPGLLVADTNIDFAKEDYLSLLKNRHVSCSKLQYAQMRIKNLGFGEDDLKKLTITLFYVPRRYVNHTSKWVHLKTVKGGDYSNVNPSCGVNGYTYGEENFVLDMPSGEWLVLIAHINNIKGDLDPIPTESVDANELNKSPYWNLLEVF